MWNGLPVCCGQADRATRRLYKMIPGLREANGTVSFAVRLVPRASRNEIVGVEGDALKIRLHAPPVEGKANEALVRFLAERLDVPRANVEIVTGHAARRKVIRVRGVTAGQIEKMML